MLEIEAKFFLGTEAAARALITRWDLTWQEGTFEVNRIFDYPDHRLRASGALVRVRERGGENWLTYKEKTDHEVKHAKVRLEYDTPVQDAAVVRHILDRLGLQEVMRYERYRARYKPGDATIEMDALPGGWFCEIESDPEAIGGRVASGGLQNRPAITWSYPEIFARVTSRCGVEARAWTEELVSSQPFRLPDPDDAFWRGDDRDEAQNPFRD